MFDREYDEVDVIRICVSVYSCHESTFPRCGISWSGHVPQGASSRERLRSPASRHRRVSCDGGHCPSP